MFLKDILPEINSSFFEGAALKHLKKTGLKKRKLLLPPETIVSEFNQVVSVIFKELLSLKKASANLTLQRDMLLSRLVNENFWVKQ